MKDNLNNKKIFDTFIVIFFIVSTILFLLFSWLLLERNTNIFSQKYNNYFGQVSLNYSVQISKELKKEFDDVFVRMEHFLDHLTVNDDSVFQCQSLYEGNDNFLGWYVYNSEGSIVCDSSNLNNNLQQLEIYDNDFLTKSQKDFWFAPSFDENNRTLLKIYKSLYDVNGSKIASLVLIMDLENFSKNYFVEDGLWYGTSFNIVSNKGQIVWSGDKDLINQNIEGKYIRNIFSNFSDALNVLQKARTGKIGFEIFDYLAQKQIASYFKVPISDGYYWSIIAYTPAKFVQSEILVDYTQNGYIFFYVVAFLLVVFLLVLYFFFRRNLQLQIENNQTKREMIEEAKKFKMSEIKLNKTVEELEKVNSTMVDRELKMIELKNSLKNKGKKK